MEIKHRERSGCPASDNFNGGNDDFHGANPWIGMTMMLATEKGDLIMVIVGDCYCGWLGIMDLIVLVGCFGRRIMDYETCDCT